MKSIFIILIAMGVMSCSNKPSTPKIKPENVVVITKTALMPIPEEAPAKEIQKSSKPITAAFQIVGGNPTGLNRNYDVYISDQSRLEEVNEYLSRLDFDNLDFIEINYYSNKSAAKTYMKKQFSERVSETEKDRLFTYYLARFLHNHSTGAKSFVYMHK